jgi:hypothetical protein
MLASFVLRAPQSADIFALHALSRVHKHCQRRQRDATHEPAAGVQNVIHFDDAGKICAAGLLTDQQSTCCLGCDATTCDHQHSQCRQCVTQMNQQQGYKIHVIHS